MDNSPDAITVRGLHKRYGSVEAVKGIDFTVRRGEIFALLGPNGAGKTTTLEILEGYRKRDGGEVDVLGYDPGARRTGRAMRERIGLVLQDIAVEAYLTTREALARNAGYYPKPRDVDETLTVCGLDKLGGKKVKDLSGGQQRRLDMALGIIGDPDLLYLDEPTTGFDPNARRGAWDLVRDLRDLGTTILLTTHYMDEAQALADRVAVIADGRFVAQGAPDSLGGRNTARTRVRFRLPEGLSTEQLPHGDAELSTTSGRGFELLTADPTSTLHALTGWALDGGIKLEGLSVDRPSLEDVYLELTGHRSGEPAGSAPTTRPSPRRALLRSRS